MDDCTHHLTDLTVLPQGAQLLTEIPNNLRRE